MDQFKTTVFGGFDKKDVVSSIEQLVRDYEEKLAALKEKLAMQEQEGQDREKNLRQAALQVQNLKKKIQANEENYQQVLKIKNQKIDENELLNRQLNFKIKALEERISKYSALDLESRSHLRRAEKLAKEKTDQIIAQAKEQIEKEYHSRLHDAKEESEALLAKTQEEANKMIERTSKRSQELLVATRRDAKGILEAAQYQAQAVVDRAESTAKKLLNQATDSLFPEAIPPKMDDAQKRVAFRLEQLQQNIDQEMHQAASHLNSDKIVVKKAKENSEGVKVSVTSMGDDGTRRYKNALKSYFKKDKE